MEQFDAIFQGCYPEVYNFLLRMSGFNRDLAEELTQETFFQAYISIAGFKGTCQLKTWLIQIAKNRFYMVLRKQKFRQVSLDKAEAEPASSFEDIADEISRRELLARARTVIDGLHPNMRDVMLYRIYSDLPYSQIALLLSISEGSAKVLFHRGKELLRKKLKEVYGYEI